MSSPLADEFTAWWAARHPHAWPVGWSLRTRGPRHWMRVHSLPDGRFEPESEAGWTELLARHREVSVATLGDGIECWLVLGTAAGHEASARFAWAGELVALTFDSVTLPAPPDEDARLVFAAARADWDFDRFGPLVRTLADVDAGVSLLAINLDPGQIYAPYPGGADLFFPLYCEHDDAMRRFNAWRSSREDGL